MEGGTFNRTGVGIYIGEKPPSLIRLIAQYSHGYYYCSDLERLSATDAPLIVKKGCYGRHVRGLSARKKKSSRTTLYQFIT
jgi:hypothetical protein